MTNEQDPRRASTNVLCFGLIAGTAVFGFRQAYGPLVYWLLVLVQCTVLCLAAWRVGASALLSPSQERRALALAGSLLILPWILFSFLAGLGTPFEATPSENQLRYLILLMNTVAVFGGFLVLALGLQKAGERFFAIVSLAGIAAASPMYTIFTAISLIEQREIERSGAAQFPESLYALDELSLVLLFFGVLLTYLATAASALALGKTQWLGRTPSRIFAVIGFAASFVVAVKMATVFSTPNRQMWNDDTWYTFPGQVLSIPAIPWIIPCLIGVFLLRRAGNEVRG